MKVLAILLLCAFVAVQGRSARVSNTRAVASLGDYPWVVHLRIAVSTSGSLHTCSGSLIDERWVLTAASCVENARFIWVRYGVVNVINPEMVTETSNVSWSNDHILGLINLNRNVIATDNIAPVSLSSVVTAPETSTYCGFSGSDNTEPGETLECVEVTLEQSENEDLIATSDTGFSLFDYGASLVDDDVQIGVLIGVTEDNEGRFASTNGYLDWIEEITGLDLDVQRKTAEKVKIVN